MPFVTNLCSPKRTSKPQTITCLTDCPIKTDHFNWVFSTSFHRNASRFRKHQARRHNSKNYQPPKLPTTYLHLSHVHRCFILPSVPYVIWTTLLSPSSILWSHATVFSCVNSPIEVTILFLWYCTCSNLVLPLSHNISSSLLLSWCFEVLQILERS